MAVLDSFFITGSIPENAETGVYIPYLVVLSYVIASLSAFTGTQLSADIRKAKTEIQKDRYHMAGAFVFGAGVWAMHFIGMLAYKMRMAISYDPFLTFLSLIIAVAIAYGVLQISRSNSLKITKIIFGSLLLGVAICGMHYTGMAAIEMKADLRYIPSLFLLSVLIAIATSGAALWIVFTLGRDENRQKLLWQIAASLVMGAAVCGMHYTGMAASVFIPHADCLYNPDQQFGLLALAVAAVSSSIFAIAIILRLRQDKDNIRRSARYTAFEYGGRRRDIGMTVFAQLGGLLSLLMTLFLGSYLYVLKAQVEKVDDSTIISGMGLQRDLAQHFSEDALEIIAGHTAHDKEKTLKIKETLMKIQPVIDQNFEALLKGGPIVLSLDRKRMGVIPSLSSDRLLATAKNTKEAWDTLVSMSVPAIESARHSGFSSPIYAEISAQAQVLSDAQDLLIQLAEDEASRNTKGVFLMQQVAMVSSLACFLITLAYARYRISLPISMMYDELKDHRDNLERRVALQTADLVRAKENAERLNLQMSEYTDKLEEARLEQMEINARLLKETETIGLLARITNSINESNDIEQAVQLCLNEVCAFTGWTIGHAYLLNERGDKLVPSHSWFIQDEEKLLPFKTLTEQTIFSSGEGIPGLVFETREYYWMEMMANSTLFPRAALSTALGIKSAMGFPVMIKKHVAAVLEFFIDDIRKPDEELKKIILNIGTQLGRIIERENIRKAKREAEKANLAKSEFLANMSHELRTPLNSIIGLSKILSEDSPAGSEEQETSSTIYRSATSLLDIVNDILDLSKIEAGGIILESIGFDLRETTAGVLETLSPMASAKGLSIGYSFENDPLPYIKGDPVRVGRIITNLVGNAIKYTSDGKIDILIGHDPIDENHTMVSCRVVDTGIGIPENKLDLIFQKFTQADETTTRRFGGTGLGLAITKDLVEMMGGKIGVTSAIGSGSTFWFQIPFETTDTLHNDLRSKKIMDIRDRPRHIKRIPVGSARILVAEDHELNLSFLKKLLGRLGFTHYDMVTNGVAALKSVQENSYDAILMDCHMPEMNGYQATGEIRKAEAETNTHIPIIALTADAMSGTREKCLGAGMDDYVVKPIDSEIFEAVLGRWFDFDAKDKAEEVPQDSSAPSVPVEMSSAAVFNLSVLKDYADTPEEMRMFCDTFVKKTDEALAEMEKQCVDGENRTWVEISHQTKGSAGMIGAVALAELCARAQLMETASRQERVDIFLSIRHAYDAVKTVIAGEVLS